MSAAHARAGRDSGLHPLAFAMLFVPVLSQAAAPEPLAPSQALQVIAGLALVLGLIAAAAWLARRLQAYRLPGRGHIRIVEGLAIGAREKLLLVEVGDKRVLLGLSPGRIQALHTFPAASLPASFEHTLAAVEARPATQP